MINLRKVDRIAFLALQNALRLHMDAITLYGKRRYPSAFFLSVLAQEEIGKMHMALDFAWNSRINGRRPAELERQWLTSLYQHPRKQGAFLRNSPLNDYKPRTLKLMEEIFNGALEHKKQRSVYVGLTRKRGQIDLKGHVRHPFSVTNRTAGAQITKINDYLLVMGVGVVNQRYSLDGSDVERLFTVQRLRSLAARWKKRSRSATTRIRQMQSDPTDTIILAV
jgi:AbiV family abortive infection protein